MVSLKSKLLILSLLLILALFIPLSLLMARVDMSVTRISGPSRYETAVAISKKGWDKSDLIILSRGDLFPDALAGAPLSAKFNAPMLLTDSQLLNNSTRDEILRLKAKEAIVLGSEDALSQKVVEDLESQCNIPNAKIHRIGGSTRYDTAALIASWLDKPTKQTAIIATGENFPDAISGASLATHEKMPILLVNTENIYPKTQEVLKNLNINKIIILGGNDVIPSGIEAWLNNKGYQTLARLSGDDRYLTSTAIADYGISQKMSPKEIFFATGEDFPDALTAAPLAARLNQTLVLTRKKFTPLSLYQWLDNHSFTNATFIGDKEAISDETEYGIRTGIRPPSAPTILSPENGAKVSEVIDIKGECDNTTNEVKLFLNSNYVKMVDTTGSGEKFSFKFADLAIREGANSMYVIGHNGAGDSPMSNEIVVTRGYSPRFLRSGKHIEINLSRQWLYTFEDNVFVNSSPCTTGRRGLETPSGNWYIYSKDRGVTLIGPDYALYVEYWMPFCGQNGLHDAWWRKFFGDPSSVAYNGSHGCVNLPPPYAALLWDWAPLGTPVDVYY